MEPLRNIEFDDRRIAMFSWFAKNSYPNLTFNHRHNDITSSYSHRYYVIHTKGMNRGYNLRG